MSGQTLDIKNFRCVPLDLLKNVDGNGQITAIVNNQSTELKDVYNDTKEDILASGQIKRQAVDANVTESILILIIVLLVIIFSVLYFYIGPSNVSELMYRRRIDIMFLLLIIIFIGGLVMAGYAIWAITR